MRQVKLPCHLILRKLCVVVFSPRDRSKIICDTFPQFTLADCKLQFVEHFHYLGHIIHSCLSMMTRKIKVLFTRTSVLCRRFEICSLRVKLKLFRSYCICLYDAALWSRFAVATYKKLSLCYSKCMKSFFGYCKYSSVTSMLFELGLPSLNTLMHVNVVLSVVFCVAVICL